jgi:hypothetical protein
VQVIKKSSKKTQARRSSMKVRGARLPGHSPELLLLEAACNSPATRMMARSSSHARLKASPELLLLLEAVLRHPAKVCSLRA